MTIPRRKRFERSVVPNPMQITERDLRLLAQVGRHRFLSSAQLVALDGGSAQNVLRCLRALFDHGYLDRPKSQLASMPLGPQAMAVGLVAIVIAGVVDSDWRHQILWLELVEVSLLLAYWPMQTAELWDPGVPTGDERAQRSERARNTRPGKAFARIARPRRHQ